MVLQQVEEGSCPGLLLCAQSPYWASHSGHLGCSSFSHSTWAGLNMDAAMTSVILDPESSHPFVNRCFVIRFNLLVEILLLDGVPVLFYCQPAEWSWAKYLTSLGFNSLMCNLCARWFPSCSRMWPLGSTVLTVHKKAFTTAMSGTSGKQITK